MIPQLRIFQVLLFLLAAVPCGIPFRYQPNPVFPSELAALVLAVLMVLTATLLPSREKSSPPYASLIWFGLAAVIALQMLLMPVLYWSDRTEPILYALTAGFSVWALARAVDHFGKMQLATYFAWGLLAGAIFNSAVSVQQVVELIQNGPRLIFGHLGQKNLYGHYVTWGLAAAAWLTAEKELPKTWFWPIAVWLALAIAWSSSRSPLMYAGAWLVFGALAAYLGKDSVRRFGWLLTASAVLIIVMQFVAPWINDALQSLLHAKNEVPTGLDRLDSNGARRFVEWNKAWITFLANPWLGIGWAAYPSQSIALQINPAFAIVQESVLFTHAHNSLLNIMAETGLAGALVMVGGMLWMFIALLKREHDPVKIFGAAMVIVSVLHSLVEYPLWYYHLLGPFALALFFMRSDAPSKLQLPNWLVRIGLGTYGVAALATAVFGGLLYIQIYPIMDPSDKAADNAARIKTLQTLKQNPLIDFYADFALSNYIVASKQDMPWKLQILDRLNQVRPYPSQLSDQAIMETLRGNTSKAHKLMRQAAFSYPESLDYFREAILEFKEPEVRALIKEVEDAEKLFGKEKK